MEEKERVRTWKRESVLRPSSSFGLRLGHELGRRAHAEQERERTKIGESGPSLSTHYTSCRMNLESMSTFPASVNIRAERCRAKQLIHTLTFPQLTEAWKIDTISERVARVNQRITQIVEGISRRWDQFQTQRTYAQNFLEPDFWFSILNFWKWWKCKNLGFEKKTALFHGHVCAHQGDSDAEWGRNRKVQLWMYTNDSNCTI